MKITKLNIWQKILIFFSFLFVFSLGFIFFANQSKKDFSSYDILSNTTISEKRKIKDLTSLDYDNLPPSTINTPYDDFYKTLFNQLGASNSEVTNIKNFINDRDALLSQWNNIDNPLISFFNSIIRDGKPQKIIIDVEFDKNDPKTLISSLNILRYISPIVEEIEINSKNMGLEYYSKSPMDNSRRWDWISSMNKLKKIKISINSEIDNPSYYLDLSKIDFISSSVIKLDTFNLELSKKIYLNNYIESTEFYKNMDAGSKIIFNSTVNFNNSKTIPTTVNNNTIYYKGGYADGDPDNNSKLENYSVEKLIGRPFVEPRADDFDKKTFIDDVLVEPILLREGVSENMPEAQASNSINIPVWDFKDEQGKRIDNIPSLEGLVSSTISRINQKSEVEVTLENSTIEKNVYYYTDKYAGDKKGNPIKISPRNNFDSKVDVIDSFFVYKQDFFLNRSSVTTPYLNVFKSYSEFDYSDYKNRYEEIIDNINKEGSNYIYIDEKIYYYNKMAYGESYLNVQKTDPIFSAIYKSDNTDSKTILFHRKKIDSKSRISNFYYTSWSNVKDSFSNQVVDFSNIQYISSVNYNDSTLVDYPEDDKNYGFLSNNLKWLDNDNYITDNVISLIKEKFNKYEKGIFYDQEIQVFKPSFYNNYDYYSLLKKKSELKANSIYYYNEKVPNNSALWENLKYKILMSQYTDDNNKTLNNFELYFYSYDDMKIFFRKNIEKINSGAIQFQDSEPLAIFSFPSLDTNENYEPNKLVPIDNYSIPFDNPGNLSNILSNPTSNLYQLQIKKDGENNGDDIELDCPNSPNLNPSYKCYFIKDSADTNLNPNDSYNMGLQESKDEKYFFSHIPHPFLSVATIDKNDPSNFIKNLKNVEVLLNKNDKLSTVLISGYVFWKRSDGKNTLSDIKYLVIDNTDVNQEVAKRIHYYDEQSYLKNFESLSTNSQKLSVIDNTVILDNLSSNSNVIPELEEFLNPSFESIKNSKSSQKIDIDDKSVEPIIVKKGSDYSIYWNISSSDSIPQYSTFFNSSKKFYSSSESLLNSRGDFLRQLFEKAAYSLPWTNNELDQAQGIDSNYISFISSKDSSVYINTTPIPSLISIINPNISSFSEWVNHMRSEYISQININNTSTFCTNIFYDNKYNWICPSFKDPNFEPKFMEINSVKSNSNEFTILTNLSNTSKSALQDIFSISSNANSLSSLAISSEDFNDIVDKSGLIIKDPTEEEFNEQKSILIKYLSDDIENPSFEEMEVFPVKVDTADGPSYFWDKDGYEYLTKSKYAFNDNSGKIIYYPDIVELYNSEASDNRSAQLISLLEKEFPDESYEKLGKVYKFEATLKSLAVESSEESRNITNLAILISVIILALGLIAPVLAVSIKIYSRKLRLK